MKKTKRSRTSKEITSNAIEQKSLVFLQNTADNVAADRLSNLLMRNQAMMKWLADPSNPEYRKFIGECEADSVMEDKIAQMFQFAIDRIDNE